MAKRKQAGGDRESQQKLAQALRAIFHRMELRRAAERGAHRAVQEQIWREAEKKKAERDERLVRKKQVALYLDILSTSLNTKTWPKPAIKNRGNRGAEWLWSELEPALRLQYPDVDWDSF
ncbi:MAG: hypothetical protein ACK46M_08370 [Planctomyces sp.]|jgi:transposase